MAQVHLITFGGGGRNFVKAARRVVRQARAFPEIASAKAFTPDDLDAGYHALFPDFAQRYPRGFGLWSWKPYLISQTLEKLAPDEILIYVDAGCELNGKAQKRFQDYLEYTRQRDALFFHLERHQNKYWTKADRRLIPDPDFGDELQVISGIFLLKKCQRVDDLVRDWLAISALDDGYLLKDVESEPQIDGFHEHRHDQSTLNAALYGKGFVAIPDETFIPFTSLTRFVRAAGPWPILALRNTGGIPFMPLIHALGRLVR